MGEDLLQVKHSQQFQFEERTPSFRKKTTDGVPELPTNPLKLINATKYNSVLFHH